MDKSYSLKLEKLSFKKVKFYIEFLYLKNIISLIIVILLLTTNSCISYKEVWLNPKEKSNAIIPNLKPVISTKNIQNELSSNYYDASNDGVSLINNYLINNIIDSMGFSKGTIEITVKKNYHKITNVGFYILSTLTVYTINLLGFPMISQKMSITLHAKIKNNKGEVIKEYTEEGFGRATSAMYWGYTFGGGLTKTAPWGLPRIVKTFALSDALKKLKKSISIDSKEINRRLYE